MVGGTVQADGLDISSSEAVAITSATIGRVDADNVIVGITSITNGIITATSTAGVVTYYGDGGRLLNLPTSQWLDIDVGLGFTSIYAQGNVGVDTTDPRFVFQVGGVPYAFNGHLGGQPVLVLSLVTTGQVVTSIFAVILALLKLLVPISLSVLGVVFSFSMLITLVLVLSLLIAMAILL